MLLLYCCLSNKSCRVVLLFVYLQIAGRYNLERKSRPDGGGEKLLIWFESLPIRVPVGSRWGIIKAKMKKMREATKMTTTTTTTRIAPLCVYYFLIFQTSLLLLLSGTPEFSRLLGFLRGLECYSRGNILRESTAVLHKLIDRSGCKLLASPLHIKVEPCMRINCPFPCVLISVRTNFCVFFS